MAYLDPASNPGSKPQRLGIKITKILLQISFEHFKSFLVSLVNLLPKMRNNFCFLFFAIPARGNTEPSRKINTGSSPLTLFLRL